MPAKLYDYVGVSMQHGKEITKEENKNINKKKWPNIDKSVIDIDIYEVIENKLYALIEEQKDDIDEYNIMRILITDITIIEYLYFYLKISPIITLFDKKYFIVKLEISNTWEHFVYLQEYKKY